jgi:hypothetical protein
MDRGDEARGADAELVGSGLDPVDLAQRMLDLGVSTFEVGAIKVAFSESAIHEAALRRAPKPPVKDAATEKREREEAAKRAELEATEAELWSVQ